MTNSEVVLKMVVNRLEQFKTDFGSWVLDQPEPIDALNEIIELGRGVVHLDEGPEWDN